MTLASIALWVADQQPEDEDVVAGPWGFAIFALLIVAVVLLGFSLTKHLRRAERAEEEGLYDPSDRKRVEPQKESSPDEPAE